MWLFTDLDWAEVRTHYDERVATHRRLLRLHDDKLLLEFASLAVGVSNSAGNFSAAEHALGTRILDPSNNGQNVLARLWNLARDFRQLTTGITVPRLVENENLKYVGVAVGSEASCMINPANCWVANSRSIWTHLAMKHQSFAVADEALELYRDHDATSKMAYLKWAAIHRTLASDLTLLAKQGEACAVDAGVEPGALKFLWADSIAGALYGLHH